MPEILFVNACERKSSRTRALAEHLLRRLSGTVGTVDLYSDCPSPMTEGGIAERETLAAAKAFDAPPLRLAKRFAEADELVIAAPFWDLSFPAVLKLYFESVTVPGVTFRYENDRPVGLCRAKRLFFVTTSGGPFLPDFGFEYVRALSVGLYGIKDVRCFFAEGLDIVGNDAEAILSDAKRKIDEFFEK